MSDDIHRKLDRIESKIDTLDGRMDRVDVRLEKYNAELEHHIARTTQVENELLPIVKHVEQVRGAMKFAGWLLAIGAPVGAAITWLWEHSRG